MTETVDSSDWPLQALHGNRPKNLTRRKKIRSSRFSAESSVYFNVEASSAFAACIGKTICFLLNFFALLKSLLLCLLPGGRETFHQPSALDAVLQQLHILACQHGNISLDKQGFIRSGSQDIGAPRLNQKTYELIRKTLSRRKTFTIRWHHHQGLNGEWNLCADSEEDLIILHARLKAS